MYTKLSTVDLSIIIPAHNEANRIIKCLHDANCFLQYRPYRSEIIVVENGSSDHTADLVKDYQEALEVDPNPQIKLISQAVGDKGQAVAAGMLAAQGWLRYMADADFSTPIWIVEDFIYSIKNTRADVVIGYRHDCQGQTLIRQIMSSTFAAATRMVLGPGIKDTQAGFKMFTARAAEMIFPLLQIYGWAFDVEALYLARQMSLEIQQLPIPWERQPDSKVKIMDPLRMLMDLARIKNAQYQAEA